MTAAASAPSGAAPEKGLRNASLGTLFLTIFLDLLGFGLVIPFLPGIARRLGAGDFVATLPGAVYSIMQFVFIPIWGRLSDRIGRRPVLLWSIGASAIGMTILGFAPTLVWLLVARIWSGAATANIAVAQAYIADVTPPDKRARGMAIVGIAFGLGFIFGPFIGGELSRFQVEGRVGMLPALVAAGLSTVNLLLALRTLPESLPPERRGQSLRRASPIDLAAFRAAVRVPGIGAAVAINFMLYLWFSGMEQTFRLFTADGFGMSDAGTGRVFGLVGIVSALVQGGLVGRLVPRFGEARLVQGGLGVQAAAFALLGLSPLFGPSGVVALLGASALIALGSGLCSPTLPAFASRRASATTQGMTLGTLQSASALARALGPLVGGAFYATIDPRAPYLIGAVGLAAAALLAVARLR
ncbi:MAG TPA: MFS transporter [Polyangia bacterium]|nr:MFS transporter [Polyangia bacterium]